MSVARIRELARPGCRVIDKKMYFGESQKELVFLLSKLASASTVAGSIAVVLGSYYDDYGGDSDPRLLRYVNMIGELCNTAMGYLKQLEKGGYIKRDFSAEVEKAIKSLKEGVEGLKSKVKGGAFRYEDVKDDIQRISNWGSNLSNIVMELVEAYRKDPVYPFPDWLPGVLLFIVISLSPFIMEWVSRRLGRRGGVG